MEYVNSCPLALLSQSTITETQSDTHRQTDRQTNTDRQKNRQTDPDVTGAIT